MSTQREPRHDKTNKMSVRPAKTQISLGIRPVWSVFAVRMKKVWVLCYPFSAQQRRWSDWEDAQADLSLRWVHSHFVGFVMSRLACFWSIMASSHVVVYWMLSRNVLFIFRSMSYAGCSVCLYQILVIKQVWQLHFNPDKCEVIRITNKPSIIDAKYTIHDMSCDMIKSTTWLCAQRRHRSAWESAQSDQSLCYALSG